MIWNAEGQRLGDARRGRYVDTADHVAVFTPGLTSTVQGMDGYGSPGLGVDHIDQLQVPANRSFYAEAKWDPVGDLKHFGSDPTTMPGMHQLQTGAAIDPFTGQPLDGVTKHSSYIHDGTTSQYNLAAVVAGHPEDVITGTNYGVTDQKYWWAPWTP